MTIPELMQAAVALGPNMPMEIQTIRTPRPRRGEVLIRVASCGVCHTDLHVLKGEVKFPFPAVLGHEVSGTVVEIGTDVSGFAPADKVVGAFIMPCGTCQACAEGRDDLCGPFFAMNRLNGTLYDGETRLYSQRGEPIAMYSMGGLAEYAVVPATGLAHTPEGLSMESAAVMGCAVLTAYGAVRRSGDVRAGETVAVVAMGGVGSNIVQIARAFGASKVIAVDVDDAKLATAHSLGATHVVNSRTEDPIAAVRTATDGIGVDVVFEALGHPQTFEQALSMLRDGGRMVAVGIAAGTTTANVEITRLVRRSQRIIGSYGARTRIDLPMVLDLASRGILNPQLTVTRTFTLDEAPLAYDTLARGEIVGRAVVLI